MTQLPDSTIAQFYNYPIPQFPEDLMTEALAPTHTPPMPLVALTEDEVLFRENIRQFAEEKIRPHVREMDEKGVFDAAIISQFFQLGLIGIEIPA